MDRKTEKTYDGRRLHPHDASAKSYCEPVTEERIVTPKTTALTRAQLTMAPEVPQTPQLGMRKVARRTMRESPRRV